MCSSSPRVARCISFPQQSLSLPHLVLSDLQPPPSPTDSFYTFFNLSLHVCFGLSCFRCPVTWSVSALFKTLSSLSLTTCPYHLTPFALLFYLMFPSNPTFPLALHYSFYPLISLLTLISPWLSSLFLQLPSQFFWTKKAKSYLFLQALSDHSAKKSPVAVPSAESLVR